MTAAHKFTAGGDAMLVTYTGPSWRRSPADKPSAERVRVDRVTASGRAVVGARTFNADGSERGAPEGYERRWLYTRREWLQREMSPHFGYGVRWREDATPEQLETLYAALAACIKQ